MPGGAGTTWIHNELKAGDRLSLTGPYGRFLVHRSAGLPSLFMAGGSGLSSPRSMILELLAQGFVQQIRRVAGADANPYLLLAAILVGLEHGLEAGREPILPLNEDRNSGIAFPLDMLEAVRAMQHQPQLREGLGAEFVDVYCENKRQDHLAFMQEISAREYRWFM